GSQGDRDPHEDGSDRDARAQDPRVDSVLIRRYVFGTNRSRQLAVFATQRVGIAHAPRCTMAKYLLPFLVLVGCLDDETPRPPIGPGLQPDKLHRVPIATQTTTGPGPVPIVVWCAGPRCVIARPIIVP